MEGGREKGRDIREGDLRRWLNGEGKALDFLLRSDASGAIAQTQSHVPIMRPIAQPQSRVDRRDFEGTQQFG